MINSFALSSMKKTLLLGFPQTLDKKGTIIIVIERNLSH